INVLARGRARYQPLASRRQGPPVTSEAEEENQVDSEPFHAPKQRVAHARAGRVAAARPQTEVTRQLVFREQLVERVRGKLSRVGEKESLPDFPAGGQPKTRRARGAYRLELQEIETAFSRHRRNGRTDHEPAGKRGRL